MMYSLYGSGHSWGWSPWMMGIGGLGIVFFLMFIAVLIALKGYSLWYAAKRNEKWWFIALLVVNTIGILEIIYLLFIVKIWPKKNSISSNSDSSVPSAPLSSTPTTAPML